jgi:hypothetical protein
MSRLKEYLEALSSLNKPDNKDEKDLFVRFKKLIDQHDWTFEMSDDHRWWSSGNANFQNMKAAARDILKSNNDALIKKANDYWEKKKELKISFKDLGRG